MSESQSAPEAFLVDDELTAAGWASALREGVLLGQRCPSCDRVTAAPKAACAQCGGRDLDVEALPTAGEIYTWTTIAVTPERFEGPYRVAIVDLGATRVLGRVPDDATIGDEVSLAGVVETDDRVSPRFS